MLRPITIDIEDAAEARSVSAEKTHMETEETLRAVDCLFFNPYGGFENAKNRTKLSKNFCKTFFLTRVGLRRFSPRAASESKTALKTPRKALHFKTLKPLEPGNCKIGRLYRRDFSFERDFCTDPGPKDG